MALVSGAHRRTPEIVANLAAGWRWWLTYALDAGAITTAEARELWDRVLACARHGRRGAGMSTSRRASQGDGSWSCSARRSHRERPTSLARTGGEPRQPARWGWRERTIGAGDNARDEWQPQGRRVGWVQDDALYLEPDAAFAAVQKLGQDTGEPLAIGGKTLSKRLHERGVLLGAERDRGRYTVRRDLEGRRRNVLHLSADILGHDTRVRIGPIGPIGPGPRRSRCSLLVAGHRWADSWADPRRVGRRIGPGNRPRSRSRPGRRRQTRGPIRADWADSRNTG